METTFAKRSVHVGRNIQKFRLLRDKSQGDVAADLEDMLNKPVSQQFISDLESKETIEDDGLLRQIAEILKVEPEVLKTMDWDAAINIVSCTFKDNSNAAHTIYQTINPLDKLIDLFEKEKAELKAEIEKLKKTKN